MPWSPGPGRGLGEARALALAEAGAEITLVARSSDQLESVAKQIHDSGGQASVHPADLTKMEEIRKLEELGPFTILVNNTGINRPQSFEDVNENDFDDVLDLNVKSAFCCPKCCQGDDPGRTRRFDHQYVESDGSRRRTQSIRLLCHQTCDGRIQ